MSRTREQLRNHFEVERELATRLRKSNREERTELFASLYNELFERVPDHPRLTRRATDDDSRPFVEARMRLLSPVLSAQQHFFEFAPGDCKLAYEVSKHVEKVVAADISDQRAPDDPAPENFELLVYDGYDLNAPERAFDVVFSYQFLEHLHPEDVSLHFDMAARLLKPGGKYVFDTPHRYSGPHDVSRFFGDELQCFHFQEWTFRDMRAALRGHGFKRCRAIRRGKLLRSSWSNQLLELVEWGVGILPTKLRKKASARLFQSVSMVAEMGDRVDS
jgi:SAM-dependent methyltransferase